ncbi:MAG: hypothetical protein ACRESZ_09960, partial [Methylococcales bacterium]
MMRWKAAIFVFLAVLVIVAASTRIPNYLHYKWEFSRGRLVDTYNTDNGFDPEVNSQDFAEQLNFRWDRQGRLLKRNGWSIADDSINLGANKAIAAYPFYYSSGGAVALRVMAATADTDNKLYWRCLLGAACPGGASTYRDVSTANHLKTEKRSTDTHAMAQMNNKLIVARGSMSDTSITATYSQESLWMYDPSYNSDGATNTDFIQSVGFGGLNVSIGSGVQLIITGMATTGG